MQAGSDQRTSSLPSRGLVSEQPLPDKEEFQFLMMTHGFFFSVQNSYLDLYDLSDDPVSEEGSR
jgi:hypothetical protein